MSARLSWSWLIDSSAVPKGTRLNLGCCLGGALAGDRVSTSAGEMSYMNTSTCSGDWCVLMNLLAWSWKRADSRWEAGKVVRHTAALWQTLCRSRSTGSRLACRSSMSVAVERSVPVMAVDASLCREVSQCVIPTDPLQLALLSSLYMGVYHMSAAYAILGTATA